MTNHQGDESTLILDFDIANSAQTEYCSTFHFPSVPPWPLGPLGPMDHVDNLDILHHLDHSDRSNHFDNPVWSMINREDNCRIRFVYLVLYNETFFFRERTKTEKEWLNQFQLLCHILNMPNQFYIHVEGVRDDCWCLSEVSWVWSRVTYWVGEPKCIPL